MEERLCDPAAPPQALDTIFVRAHSIYTRTNIYTYIGTMSSSAAAAERQQRQHLAPFPHSMAVDRRRACAPWYVCAYVNVNIILHTKSRIHSLTRAHTHTNKNHRGLHATTLPPPSTSSTSSTKTRRTAAGAGGGGGGGQAAPTPGGKGKGEATNTHTGNSVTVEDFAAQLEPFGVTGIRFCEGA